MPLSDQTIVELVNLSTMTLATTGPDGEPHNAPLYFAADRDLRLYFFSDPASQHARDLAGDERAAVSFYPLCQGWESIRGVQMRGTAGPVEPGAAWEAGRAVYREKFPFVEALEAEIAQNQLYVFVPRWVRLVDNRRGFGFKREWTLR